ncbi:MAG TPA: DUF2520 domain-containing protein [Noviherbaspirillum sp.]
MKTLNIIGCGRAGKALARLWTQQSIFAVQDVLNRTSESAQHAVSFIGAGRAIEHYADLRVADVYMITTADDQIAQCCEALANAGKLTPESVVFHCSGALPSATLQAAAQCGAAVASIHPIRSFADPEQAANEFAGTWCGAEGDPQALDLLNSAFSAIGARIAQVHAHHKIIYHSAAVFACNYLVTLLDIAVQAYGKAGVPQDAALDMMEPLVRGTIDNVFRIGPAAALNGPIARGDMTTAEKQAQAVAAWDREYGKLYEQFVGLTVELAARRSVPQY